MSVNVPQIQRNGMPPSDLPVMSIPITTAFSESDLAQMSIDGWVYVGAMLIGEGGGVVTLAEQQGPVPSHVWVYSRAPMVLVGGVIKAMIEIEGLDPERIVLDALTRKIWGKSWFTVMKEIGRE